MYTSKPTTPSIIVKRPKGFTLIELLVVIAIIAILAAILFPVFATAREKARQTTCASNEKQIGIAMLQYTQDYDELLPVGGNNIPNSCTGQPGRGWAGKLMPYIKAAAVFDCPDDQTVATNANYVPYSYADNVNFFAGNVGGNPFCNGPVIPITKMVSTTTTVYLYEVYSVMGAITPTEFDSPSGSGYNNYGAGNGEQYLLATPAGAPNPTQGQGWGRHTNGMELLMADGHVKYFQYNQVSTGYALDTSIAPKPVTNANLGNGNSFAVTFNYN